VLLWLPVALLIDHFRSEGVRVYAYLIFCIYVLIGFIPYGHANLFIGRGGLTVLAYPRLFLILAMFVVSIIAVMRPSRQPVAPVQSALPAVRLP
jgi:hypothetical protein